MVICILYVLLSFVMGSVLARFERYEVDGPDFVLMCIFWPIITVGKLLRLVGVNCGKSFKWWLKLVNKK